MNICEKCSKDKSLKNLILSKGVSDTCSLCGKKRKYTISTSDEYFIRMIACLVRYYFSEWKYHSKLGGRILEWHLSDPNSIFDYPDGLSSDQKDDFIMSFYDEIFKDDKVPIITAYGRDIYNYMPYQAVRNGNQDVLNQISKELKERNYFLVEPEYESYFKAIEKHISTEVKKGSVFYRARKGATKSAFDYDLEENTTKDYYTPHKGKDIGAPPIVIAGSGRVNRPGVSYLYLASERDTAISEVRPHPSELVSTGQFEAKADLKIADLSTHIISEQLMSEDGLDTLAFIIGIENLLSTANPPSNNTFYGTTQFVTEIFRKQGFDGILFKSSVSGGKNLVAFDPSKFIWKENSGEVFEIEKTTYSYKKSNLFDETYEYYDRKL